MERIKQACALGRIKLKSTQIFIVAGAVLLTLFITVLCIGFLMRYEVESDVANLGDVDFWNDHVVKEQQFWYDKGIDELRIALNTNYAEGFPRQVIIYLATGVGAELLAAARFQNRTHKPAAMAWEHAPHLGRLKNSCSQANLCDASTVASALFAGVKSNLMVAGLDAAIAHGDCQASLNETHRVSSILRQAQLADYRTGFITTQRITGPTGAALYAHLADTSWECDAMMPKGIIALGCQDVARQMLEGNTGRNLNVIMGGGRQMLTQTLPVTAWNPLDEFACRTQDQRNFLRDWRAQKLQNKTNFEVLTDKTELKSINSTNLDYLLGVFANSKLRRVPEMPTLSEMLDKARPVLDKSNKGYLLVVEQVFSIGNRTQQLEELTEFSEFIEQQMKKRSKDTLALVVFTNGQYINHGLEISAETEIVNDFFDIIEQDSLLEQQLREMVDDTLVFAQGPKSSLFHGIHDETYLAHLVAYAMKMGVFQNAANENGK